MFYPYVLQYSLNHAALSKEGASYILNAKITCLKIPSTTFHVSCFAFAILSTRERSATTCFHLECGFQSSEL
ncbi:MAG TPA: hypothetical protein VFU79_02725 [Nitrososphaeraceae archaeon]|nr:hypothetical protein [Nitrososphaeraceae archaeon]